METSALLGSASSCTPGTLSKRRLLDDDDDLVGTSDYLQIAVRGILSLPIAQSCVRPLI